MLTFDLQRTFLSPGFQISPLSVVLSWMNFCTAAPSRTTFLLFLFRLCFHGPPRQCTHLHQVRAGTRCGSGNLVMLLHGNRAWGSSFNVESVSWEHCQQPHLFHSGQVSVPLTCAGHIDGICSTLPLCELHPVVFQVWQTVFKTLKRRVQIQRGWRLFLHPSMIRFSSDALHSV